MKLELIAVVVVLPWMLSCSTPDPVLEGTAGISGKGGSGGSSGKGGTAGISGKGGGGGNSGGTAGTGVSGTTGGVGGVSGGTAGTAGIVNGGSAGMGGAGACPGVLEQILKPIDRASTAPVAIVSETSGVRTLFVNARAGGQANQTTNPRVYVSLSAATRVSITDLAARTSDSWDLAFKRPSVFANGGHGGPGGVSVAFLAGREFDTVTQADVVSAGFKLESFHDAACTPTQDSQGNLITSFEWYDYDINTHVLTPKPGTYLVKRSDNALFKVRFISYYGTAEGGTDGDSGNYLIKIAPL